MFGFLCCLQCAQILDGKALLALALSHFNETLNGSPGLAILHGYRLLKNGDAKFCQKKSIGHPVCHFMKIEFECGNEEKMGDIFNFNFKLIPFSSAKFAALAKSQMPR